MAQSTEEILKQSQQQTNPPTPSTAGTLAGTDSPASAADTYRAMVDPEAASFETPDAANMKPNIPPLHVTDKQPAANRQADTYRAMVDPEAASFETPDAANMKPDIPPGR